MIRRTSSIMTSRREFLQKTVAGGAALMIGFHWPALAQNQSQEKAPPNPFNAWIHIDQNGHTTLTVAKSEMGQGVMTALPMILAEELDVDWNAVRVEQAATRPELYGDQGTGGSGSVFDSWMPLRQAGAAARQMLIAAAAQTWGVNPETCSAKQGAVFHGPRHWRLAYGELVAAASKLPVPDFHKVPLKNPDDFTIVGKAMPRAEIPEKVSGKAIFGLDVKVPGMLYAVVARCPTFGGKAAHFEAAKAKAVPGVREVLEIPAVGPGAYTAGGVAVVAESTWSAIEGRRALEIEWDRGPHASETSQSLNEQLASAIQKTGKITNSDGDAEKALASAPRKIEAIYEMPFLAHATMEPMNCTVDVRADRAEVWAPTQGPDWIRDMVARIAGLKPEAVEVHTTLMGGAFGRRYQSDFGVEAAQISKAVGKPVQVVWTREDDMQHDFYRQATHQMLTAALDDLGKPVAWRHRIASTSIRAFWDPSGKQKPERQEIGGAANNVYRVPNFCVEYTPVKSGVPVAWWRSVEESMSGFTVESFIDELAAAAKIDPLKYRLNLLGEPRQLKHSPAPETDSPLFDVVRLRHVLELAAEKAGWGKPLPRGRGRGIAAFYSFDTYVAEVAEVSADRDGAPTVHRVVCAVDCGQVVNPDGVKAQMEGAIVYGLTAALKGAITIENGAVQQSNFHDYPMLRINEMPLIEVYIVPSRERPTGTGEPGLPPIAPAVANAIFAATGKRIRRLPINS